LTVCSIFGNKMSYFLFKRSKICTKNFCLCKFYGIHYYIPTTTWQFASYNFGKKWVLIYLAWSKIYTKKLLKKVLANCFCSVSVFFLTWTGGRKGQVWTQPHRYLRGEPEVGF
jgi:hypothetical protein